MLIGTLGPREEFLEGGERASVARTVNGTGHRDIAATRRLIAPRRTPGTYANSCVAARVGVVCGAVNAMAGAARRERASFMITICYERTSGGWSIAQPMRRATRWWQRNLRWPSLTCQPWQSGREGNKRCRMRQVSWRRSNAGTRDNELQKLLMDSRNPSNGFYAAALNLEARPVASLCGLCFST